MSHVELGELLKATNKDIVFFKQSLKENSNNDFASGCLVMAQRYKVLIEEKIERKELREGVKNGTNKFS